MDSKRKKQFWLLAILITAILIIDQTVKIWVKTHMYIGEEIPLIGDWCLLNFVENKGFAFGISLGENAGKVILSLFRLVASAALLWFVIKLIKKDARTPMVCYLSLIIAGAIGNLIDSWFYGLIFSESTYRVAEIFPAEGGYASLMHGKVVDMFYFPLFEFTWPSWFPFVGGKSDMFFNAIFNVADAAITVGAIWFIIDVLFFADKKKQKENEIADGETEQSHSKPLKAEK